MLALGAKGVLLGRAWLYAMAARGEAGVTQLLDLIAREMRVAMTLTGAHSITEINRKNLAGKLPVAMMEGSGLGYSGLILARTQLQRTPMLLLASHNRALGEAYDYHAAGCIACEAMLKGMNIPYVTIQEASQIPTLVKQALITVKGQKTAVGVLVPGYVVEAPA